MHNPFSLSGKTILITGASSGIGRAIAIECSRMGASIVITGRNADRLQETYQALEGNHHLAIIADLSKTTDTQSLCEQLPALDGLVQNAGISKRMPCRDIEENDYAQVMDTNLQAPVMLQAALLSNKKIKKEASVVFTASRAAFAPATGNALYSASKGALISYAKVLALELAPRKIRVNCICPAMVWTGLIASENSISKEDYEAMQLKYPLKRYGTPEDIAYLAVYLLSDASSWMTGSCVDITGGGEGTLI